MWESRHRVIGPSGQAKTSFLKCILETFGKKKAFFIVGGNASRSGLIDVLFDLGPKYLLIDEIEHVKPEYQTTLLSLMATGISTQTMWPAPLFYQEQLLET